MITPYLTREMNEFYHPGWPSSWYDGECQIFIKDRKYLLEFFGGINLIILFFLKILK